MRANLKKVAQTILLSGSFDGDHYTHLYADVAASALDPLQHYIEYGAAEGRLPNEWFDPTAYRLLTKAGVGDDFSAFLHFIALPDEEKLAYRREVQGISARAMVDALIIARSSDFESAFYLDQIKSENPPFSAILHYVGKGSQAGLWPNPVFDPAFYRRQNSDVVAAGVESLAHYITYGRNEGRSSSYLEVGPTGVPYSLVDLHAVRDSGLFDEAYYRETVTILPADVDPLLHYLNVSSLHHVSPSREFDAAFYYATVPDARHSGLPPLVHYLRHGCVAEEAILPDGRYYWIDHPTIGDNDVHIERLHAAAFTYRHAIENELLVDAVNGFQAAVDELAKHARPTVAAEDPPEVSIIIPVYGQLPVVLSCLDSLSKHASRYSFEIILFDDASPEPMRIAMLADIPWLNYVHGGHNQGFIGACNHAAELAKGDHIVLLNSDTRVCHGWLDELIDTFATQPLAGFVGSKLYYGDGSLQEAGGIIWEDGTAWNYGRNDRPDNPEYCYARQVDYCSGAAIAIPRALWQELGGFDTYFAPAYYEDVDLAYRIREAGRQVWLQPLARVIHYEGMTHGRDETKGIKAIQVVNAKKFYERWQNTLKNNGRNGERPLLASNRIHHKRMLAIDAETPAPRRDAGSVMTVKLLQIYQKLGWHVTFMPFHDPRFHAVHSPDLQRVGIEVLSHANMEGVLRSREGMYEAVLGFRVTVLESLIDRLRAIDPAMLVMFHDIDLHYLRMEREAEIKNSTLLARKADLMKTVELELVAKVDCTIVPSTVEKDIIHEELGVNNVVVYSYTADIVTDEIDYADRQDIAFVGGFRHQPNVDAMQFFIEEVWPRLEERLPPEAKFYIIGSDAPSSLEDLANDRIIFTGFLEDLAPTLQTCRAFVAPLRYGAGLKGKVVTSLSHGLPCIASAIAIEGMALTPEVEVLEANDADAFVAQVLRVYEDEKLWNKLRQAGYSFVERQYSWETGLEVANEILQVAESSWYDRQKVLRGTRLKKALAEHGNNVHFNDELPAV